MNIFNCGKTSIAFAKAFANLAIITEDECRIGRGAFTEYSIRGSIDDILRMKQRIYHWGLFKPE